MDPSRGSMLETGKTQGQGTGSLLFPGLLVQRLNKNNKFFLNIILYLKVLYSIV